ncbi:hypothetical protein F5X96DRAFT_637786 [Biscogniauxia mediterranea]|nr:hypothetical protein F5X96DRAFT_637786 [Biscogniauxia mediterranea]
MARDSHDAHDLAVFPEGLRGRKILLCTESFGPVNGVSRTTLMLVNHLRSHGALVSVVAPYNHTKVNTFSPINNLDDDKTKQVPYCSETRLTGYPLPFNPELSVVYPVRLSELYRRSFGGPPDIIYLASPASLGFQVMLQLRQQVEEAQVPAICNFQTDLAGYCSILFPSPLGDIASWLFAMVQGYLFRHASVKTVFYPSTFVKRYLEDVAGVQSGKLSVLRRGVNTDGFHPQRRSEELRKQWAPNGELILFTCSRLAGEKGFGFLAQVANELHKRHLDFKLVIVGGNRNSIVEEEIKEMFEPLRANGKVIFTGFKVGEELTRHYASADIFLHCSVTETFGLVVLEAMASGVPVIARDEGGPSDTIDHGKSGFLVPPDDLDEFVQKVLELADDPKLCQQIGEAGRAQALEATWETIGNKVAWNMLQAIEDREKNKESGISTRSVWLVKGLLLYYASIRQRVVSRIVDAKLLLGLLTILGFWACVSVYLVFTNTVHLARTRAPGLRAMVKLTGI